MRGCAFDVSDFQVHHIEIEENRVRFMEKATGDEYDKLGLPSVYCRLFYAYYS